MPKFFEVCGPRIYQSRIYQSKNKFLSLSWRIWVIRTNTAWNRWYRNLLSDTALSWTAIAPYLCFLASKILTTTWRYKGWVMSQIPPRLVIRCVHGRCRRIQWPPPPQDSVTPRIQWPSGFSDSRSLYPRTQWPVSQEIRSGPIPIRAYILIRGDRIR